MLRKDSDIDDQSVIALTLFCIDFAEENETRNVAGAQNDVITSLNAVPLHEQCVRFRLGH